MKCVIITFLILQSLGRIPKKKTEKEKLRESAKANN